MRWNTRLWNGSIGSIIVDCSNRSVMCHQRSSRKRIIGKIRVRLWWPDSNPELSGNPGAVHQDAPVAPAIAAKQEKKPRKGGGRRAAPEHLPIERVEIDLPEAEKAGLVRIREEITEELDYQPSQFIRRHYVRFVYADPTKQTAPKLPELPARVIPQASVGVGLLVHLLVSKYTDHIPLYRFEQIAARVGVELARQKLCRWVEEAALLLRTIHDRLRRQILADGYVQVDETPVKVLDPDRGGHAALAYLWTYLSPLSQAIVFDFDLSRGRGNLREFFPTE